MQTFETLIRLFLKEQSDLGLHFLPRLICPKPYTDNYSIYKVSLFSFQQMENLISGVRDTNLKLTLAFGIGIHHAGLVERDRKMTEELFVNAKIQVGKNVSVSSYGI